MRKFTKRITLFLLPIIGLFILSPLIDDVVLNFNIDKSKKILVAGDSHVEVSIKDTLDFQNIGFSSETYFFTYYKIKKVLEHKNVEKIVLAFAPHNISSIQEDYTYGLNNNKAYRNLYPTFIYSLPKDAVKNLYMRNPKAFKELSTSLFRPALKEIFKFQNKYIGKYQPVEGNHLDIETIDKAIRLHYYRNDSTMHQSNADIKYIYKILELAHNNNAELVLVNFPLHPVYREKIPERFQKRFETEVLLLQENGAKFLDYSEIILPDYFYLDGHHINKKGSEILTPIILQDLK